MAWDIDGGLWFVVVRGLSVVALLSLFGTLVFQVFVLPRTASALPADAARAIGRRLRWLDWASLAVGLVSCLGWLALQSASMVGARSIGAAAAAIPLIAGDTAFGHVLLGQLAALAGAGVALAVARVRVACGVAAVACALQAGHSHAASMYQGPSLLLAADAAHLLAAGAWLGALLPLLITVQRAPADAAALAARWFSPMGQLCLVGLTATAGFQGWVLVGTVPGLVGTAFGWMTSAKLALFGVLFVFAVANRYRFAPALLRGDPARARRTLLRSLAWQTGAGVAILAAATVLSSLPPSMHEQAFWPFPDRFTRDTIDEDPELGGEVLWALGALAGAGLLVVVAMAVRRRVRWLAAAAAVVVAWFAVPHLDLLFVPAYPTSFFHSPTAFAATSIVRGAALYPDHCASCHGATGHGDGPDARGQKAPPADLTAAHVWMHSDGELFWWLGHGIEAPEGGLAMPGFAAALSEDDRWALIDYVRGHNGGVQFQDTGGWEQPMRAPELQAECSDRRTVSLADLRGGFVRLVIGVATGETRAGATGETRAGVTGEARAGVTTIVADAGPGVHAAPGLCVADDSSIGQAYAVVSGMTAEALTGAEFLIDGDGWLRAVQPAGAEATWDDPRRLSASIAQLRAHPVGAPEVGGMDAHMPM